AKQLIGFGIPTVDLHGNLSQNARTRNMDAFHTGKVSTLVATDIAARGIHVDDVSLVVHADPPTEHKAYLHRSGRTARAGNAGTVVTLELPTQRNEVRTLLRQAKINATSTAAHTGADILVSLAPGQRTFLSPAEAAEKSGVQPKQEQGPRRSGGGGNSGGRNGSRNGSGGSRNGSASTSGGRSGGSGGSGGSGRTGGSARPANGAARAGTTSAADFSRNFRRSR
ncbi:MAG: C-terminal helicase domain-containing protein, partial [Propionibacteriaceae bacterium]|nr:C-terminal helicase domain-containing protein [Propionibacteriaceae bacterium]